MTYTILLVEDDPWLAELYHDIVQKIPSCSVLTAASADAALTQLDTNKKIDLIILDMFLPQHNGIELLHELASYEDSGQIPVVILSNVSPHDFRMSQERWRQYGVQEYLDKSKTKPQDLVAAVKKQLAYVEVQV
ncbi:MAG: response regulator [Candidatus Saccharimonadales bacterium]